MADSEGRFPPPSLPASHMSNKYRKRNGETESERRKEPFISAQLEVEVFGTVGVCDAGRMSSLLLWCSHCAPTVLKGAGHPELQQ